MTAEIIELIPEVVGEGYRFDSEKILDAAKEYKFDRLMIVGELEDGSMYCAGTANAGETLILLERAKHSIIFGE